LGEKIKSRPSDARAQRSRAALRKALLELVQVRPFEQISVRELAAAAKLSHPTFYRNYSSIQEILGEIAADEMQQLMAHMLSLVDRRAPRATARAICDYIHGHRALWTTLMTTGATSVLRDEWIRLTKNLASQRPQINPDLPLSMVSAVVVAGMMEILSWWLQQDEDYPAENVAQFLDRLILTPTIGPDTFVLE
jgi:AcrR family transcriptional regulator